MFEHMIVLKEKKKASEPSSESRVKDLANGAANVTQVPNLVADTDENGPEADFYGKEREIRFFASPEVNESGSALYMEISEIRSPASVSVYMGSPSRIFNINAKLISRTELEAQKNWHYINILRSWRMPNQNVGQAFKSAEPSVLNMFGYGKIFKGIPVVIKNISFDFNTDSDYIKSKNGSDIPIILPVSIQLQEMRTVEDMNTFDIKAFREGKLNWW